MAVKLPGVNYQAPVSTDDLGFQADTTSEEIQERTRLLIDGEFGIVDDIDPQDISITDLTRPLNVTPSTDIIRVDINPGTAVTEAGNWVRLDNKIFLFELASTAVGAQNVVFIEYFLEEGEDRRLNQFNVDVAVREQRPATNEDVIKVETLGNFNNTSLYTPDRKRDIVVLAIATVNQVLTDGVSVLDITIDLGDTNFAYNRPWYSPVDIAHRGSVGTATPTITNPHGTSLNDLAAGNLTLYQQTLAHGMVMSKDVGVSKMPGSLLEEPIQAASFLVDTTGELTRRSTLYGGVGARFVNLRHFIIRLGSVYETGFPANQIAADFVPGESIVVIPANEVIPDNGVTFEYLVAYAGEAPAADPPPTNDLTFGQPLSTELIVADGIAVTNLPTPIISFDGSGPIPRDFRVFVDANGALLKSPQILLAPTKLDALVGSVPISAAMQGDAPIEIGMTRAANVTGMEVTIKITGLPADPNDDTTQELTFEFGTYQDSAIPGTEENPNQFVRTDWNFSQVSFIEVMSRSNDGNDSTIIVYAAQEAHITPTFNEKCALANIFWSGLSVDEIRDVRPVNLDLHLPKTPLFHGYLIEPAARPWIYEDFRTPKLRDSYGESAAPTAAVGTIAVAENGLLEDGDTIDLGLGKVLTARKPISATGSLAALATGIDTTGISNFDVDESVSGGSLITVNVGNTWYSTELLASDLRSALNSGTSNSTVYTVTVVNRTFTVSGTKSFDLPNSPLATAIGLNAGGGGSLYTGSNVSGLEDGDQFRLKDGVNTVTFEFNTGGGVTGNNENVGVNPNWSAGEVQTEMIRAINESVADLDITASVGGGSDIDLVNENPGAAGNLLIGETIPSGSSLNPVGMEGGSDGGADSTVGEFDLGTGLDALTTANNIVSTLADPTFDSEITGLQVDIGVDADPGVSLTRDVAGLTNNEILLTLAGSPPGFEVTGFERGTDLYIAVSPDAFAEGLRTKIPTVSATSEEKNRERRKYRSRAVAIPSSFSSGMDEISLVIHNPEDVTAESVRVRSTFATDPGNWQDYEPMTLVAINPSVAVFSKDFGRDIFKIQLEMFGTFTDYAITDVSDVLPPFSGPTGPSGADGDPGQDGAVGATGAAGAFGGPTGASGADGAVGVTGTDGTDGATGADGDVGATGPITADFFSQSYTSSTVWVVAHNLNSLNVLVSTYDSVDEQIIPATVEVISANQVNVTFTSSTAGRVVVIAEV
jgi:hypothetical protein